MTPEERRVKKVISKEEARELRQMRVQDTWKLDPQVKVMLKGKEYVIEFNNYAVKEIFRSEKQINIMKDGVTMETLQDPEALSLLLYWGLKEHHPDLTQDELDRLFTYKHYGYIVNKLTSALDMFTPDMSDVNEQDEDQQVNGVARPS